MPTAVSQSVVVYPARAPSSTTATLYARTAALGATTVVTLDFGYPYRKLALVRFKVKRVAGTAANFTPYIFSESGITTAGSIAQEFAGANTLVATLFDPGLGDAPIEMQCDVNGRLYVVLAPNAGSDNTFDICLRFLARE